MKNKPDVIIEVVGGSPRITYNPNNINISIRDYDVENLEYIDDFGDVDQSQIPDNLYMDDVKQWYIESGNV